MAVQEVTAARAPVVSRAPIIAVEVDVDRVARRARLIECHQPLFAGECVGKR